MNTAKFNIDGIEIKAEGNGIERAIKFAEQLLEPSIVDQSYIESQVRLAFILSGLIEAVKTYRQMIDDRTGETPSLINSKREVERICQDLEDIKGVRSTINNLKVQRDNLQTQLGNAADDIINLSEELRQLKEEKDDYQYPSS